MKKRSSRPARPRGPSHTTAVPGPTRHARALHGVLGALLGGTVGYGIASSSPVQLHWSWELLRLVGGLALACGVIGALFPRTFWRPRYAPRWWQP